ncbi:FAD-binding oxidoreductase [Terricaulis silvestris]|uniref:Putative decaprenylphosphoryl-beta-D-ribose oxidase n=1 Tax=Terricaulis silvestris TaxID=2686094 RepID=A0A6I6MT68_9CAUL|nr:FAD-binding oxidoreductase [Terricaulis silvestris]QGZ96548.1 putative decaprenylphosphoryl-beta-D-ribose oxidase [Terricaulis silvestris]
MSTAYVNDDTRLSWGRVVRSHHLIAKPRFVDEIAPALADASVMGLRALPVGLGRSYGDSNLNPGGALIDLSKLDRIVAFDTQNGVLRADSGISLSDILRFSVPRGWFLPTTPGTRFVTLGGSIANDVHGKNHHAAGSVGCSIRRVGLVRSDRGALELASDIEPELFAATIGGLGLTGVIAWAEIQMVPIVSAYIEQEVLPFDDLDSFFDIAEASQNTFEHTVAWIDCTASGRHLGRGLFTRGNWAPEGGLDAHSDKLKLTMPVDGTPLAFNALSLRVLNTMIRTAQSFKAAESRVHYEPHLYPLDAIGAWNRLYGRAGFYQYQCIVPPDGRAAIAELLCAIADEGAGSVLGVLKSFGPKRSPGLLSFPMEGFTLAMDFCNAGARTHALFARLDAIVRAANGRLYAAKDGRMPASMFQTSYPEWARFAKQIDPLLTSAFWDRVSQ